MNNAQHIIAREWLWWSAAMVTGLLFWRYALDTGADWRQGSVIPFAGLQWGIPCYLAFAAIRLTVWAIRVVRLQKQPG